jgi:senataxin
MPDAGEIIGALQRHWKTLKEYPEELHLLCPKVNDDDIEDYDRPEEDGTDATAEEKVARIASSVVRRETTVYLSLLLGMDASEHGELIQAWKDIVEKFLHKCDRCIVAWHSMRKAFLGAMKEYVYI